MRLRPVLFAAPLAVVAMASLACLTSASAFDGGSADLPELAQANPPTPPAPPLGAGPGAGPGMHGPMSGGPMGNGPMMQPRPFSPQKMCEEHVARRIGNRAYLKARLDLKPEQMSAWNAFEKAADEASAKAKAACAQLPTELQTPPNFADRLGMREAMMKTRLASIEAVKPSLLALYAALTPEQKEILDRPMMGGHMMHGPHGRGPG
ncbi:LTXXQ motif family protein [Enhydrobacter aerosaccus]|uniref:LTXXQ motif family protein n=1 Tax=Enhydrobacter aerosaccus TaxID=225324 RepID=A0A1T4TE99_9HYPH|nr:Spy/CpxP family protein refolding chaperone [Enhydrobacter aerosaccus]SKA38558.1 LTXXQ motif family protein [Enhydrobacter aerosaccus]